MLKNEFNIHEFCQFNLWSFSLNLGRILQIWYFLKIFEIIEVFRSLIDYKKIQTKMIKCKNMIGSFVSTFKSHQLLSIYIYFRFHSQYSFSII